MRNRAQSALSQPGYYKMPELQRAVVWQQAGLDGNPPMSIEEWEGRQRFQSGLNLGNLTAVENLRHANDMDEIDQRGLYVRSRGGASGSNLAVSERNALNDAAMSLSAIEQLRGLRKGGTAGTGEVAGRANALKLHIPEALRPMGGSWTTPDTGFADFKSVTAGLKNRTVRAITGAAVGVQEEKRIMDEIPLETDESDVWESKAQATENNLRYLQQLIQDRAAGRSGGASGGDPYEVNSFTGRPQVNVAPGGGGQNFNPRDPLGIR